MDKLTLVGSITFVILFFSVLLSLFLLTVKSSNKMANRLLAAYFIVFAIHISVFFYAKYIELPLILERLRDQIMSLASPLLFLYLVASIYADLKLRVIHLLHLLPLFIGVLIYTPRFYAASSVDQALFMANFHEQYETKISYVISILISTLYLILMFAELRKYKKLLVENYTNTASFNYKWLYQLTQVVTIIFVFAQFKQVYKFLGNEVDTLNLMRLALILVLLTFLFWIALKSMLHPELFRAIDSKHQLVTTLVEEIEDTVDKKEGSVNQQLEQLQKFMIAEEPFLDPSLNLQKLASQLQLPSRELSILINHHLNQHFFEFIAHHRIKKAIELLENPANEKRTILEILYEVGFNSKSPFNKAFKKHTGLTPSAYRAKLSK